ncbi:hypothetical protein A2803_04325 [Candidatus Woesebacteria bacterium RIFCSPHIGHO2_01_FULL_44_21]|uniref:Uncharacterized protein n=1 Tax=Candidatus Woesebacteria bacterium RIFCSPHIGHO2_01_FULL_44_21 TaxID=1802503 RepID=A0A1F7Z388_9BACT|nr:MAG: hypothetical protein A2803_04325 [Candidatus Woesebacteria bacterium RIFCSPHIGHO2_01_FULL_44_21]OGM71495.1 MAG: hypothetical protein A2897_04210 [Candidatus Woesebacteria bacterium RIFCSPLOWO2_01_FULL_44_24b]
MLERSGYLPPDKELNSNSLIPGIVKRISTADEEKAIDLRTVVYDYDGLEVQQRVIETVRFLFSEGVIEYSDNRLRVK